MFEKTKKFYHYYGFKATLQRILQKLIGVENVKEEIDSLYFFLNSFHKASAVPLADDPDLRDLQLCDTQLLRIVQKECEKLGLTYWLEFGTLLGAVRHKGFIPWDDDMDIAMPRKDYNRALTELKEILSKYDIDLYESNHISICYKHSITGIWLDIFAIDDFYTDECDDEVENRLKQSIIKCRKDYLNHKSNPDIIWKEERRKKIINGGSGLYRYLYLQPEFLYSKAVTHIYDNVFPLKKIDFEGLTVNVPNNYNEYLKDIYGSSFMNFPRIGVMPHDLGRGALSTWAKRNGVDMSIVLDKLTSIAEL